MYVLKRGAAALTILESSTLIASSLVVAFKVYDIDCDGFISNGELFLVLKMMVGNNLKVRPAIDFDPAGMCDRNDSFI